MFTGIGGFELGIKQAYELQEMEVKPTNSSNVEGRASQHSERSLCVGFSEIDKYAISVYKYHFPNIKNYGDATKIVPSTLPDFDLLTGGFPCQAFSIAGKRKGFDDTRGTLFFDIARIVKEKRPKYLLLENVKGLLSHDEGRTFKTILSTLDELRYDLQWQVLNAKNHGVPQNRERVFIVGHLRGEPRPKVFPLGEGYAEDDESRILAHTVNSSDWRGGNRNQRQTTIEQLNNPTHSNDRLYGTDGVSPTLNTAQGGNRQPKIIAKRNDGMEVEMTEANAVTPDAYLASGKRKVVNGKTKLTSMFERRIRRLTPLECERLMGFPDNWTKYGEGNVPISDTQRYKMCGNAVVVNVVKDIMNKLLSPKEK